MRIQRNFCHVAIRSQVVAGLLILCSGAVLGLQTPTKHSSDAQQVRDLRIASGSLLIQGENNKPVGPLGLLTYRLEEVPLDKPIDIFVGKKQRIESVIRLTITGKSIARANVIWINDARLTGLWSNGLGQIGTFIGDRSILEAGATISVQDSEGMHWLPEVLKLPETFPVGIASVSHEGNVIVGIRRSFRVFGSVRQPLVQIELSTSRPFPVRNAALQVQIGKQFFSNELATINGSLIVSLPPEIFATLKNGAEVLAGFSFSRNGGLSDELRYFGRLDKNMLDK
jgi:hypothetical protein